MKVEQTKLQEKKISLYEAIYAESFFTQKQSLTLIFLVSNAINEKELEKVSDLLDFVKKSKKSFAKDLEKKFGLAFQKELQKYGKKLEKEEVFSEEEILKQI